MSVTEKSQTGRPDAPRESTRARYPDEEGFAERDGVRIFYEVYGDGDETVFFLPPWSIVHSRIWKGQIPYFARHYRVLVHDPRGNGRSDAPAGAAAYAAQEFVDDALAVMDATGTETATLVGVSRGPRRAMMLAAQHPERVTRAALVAPGTPLTPVLGPRLAWAVFEARTPLQRNVRALSALLRFARESPSGLWSPAMRRALGRLSPLDLLRMFSRDGWQRDPRPFVEWFMAAVFPEPHSTKPIEDAVTWGLEISPQALIDCYQGEPFADRDAVLELCAQVRCPTMVIHGGMDLITPPEWGRALAAALGAPFVLFEGAGHAPESRAPALFNVTLREFIERGKEPRRDPTVHRSDDGRPRALFVSSPIGLGHAQRDVAIARELRALVADLQIDWLAQDPVTRVLEAEGERIHPASPHLASESAHFESESAEHDLHCFHAYRRMDEILCANFMLFHDVAQETRYDAWIADEGWELDYFLHEHPQLKRAPFAWLTDFVGFLPMEDADERERFLTADYNAEMVDHVAAHPDVRDQAIFVGNPEDIVPGRLGPDLPGIRAWTEQHFDFAGYITGFDAAQFADRGALRAELGYEPDEQVCIVTVGGSGVGVDLLRRVIAAYPEAKRQVPALRMIVVAGPRIDGEALAIDNGLEVRPYVHNLYRHLAGCDLAVVQGGLTTAMELTANRRPFLYFPLRHHFEQNLHVAHRLARYGAGRRMDFDTSSPEAIADAISAEIGRPVAYRAVEPDGARRAAERIAQLL
jgi:pimeloyl-ACP methyl ester carboxylesterase/predicted glycosyltransferase